MGETMPPSEKNEPVAKLYTLRTELSAMAENTDKIKEIEKVYKNHLRKRKIWFILLLFGFLLPDLIVLCLVLSTNKSIVEIIFVILFWPIIIFDIIAIKKYKKYTDNYITYKSDISRLQSEININTNILLGTQSEQNNL